MVITKEIVKSILDTFQDGEDLAQKLTDGLALLQDIVKEKAHLYEARVRLDASYNQEIDKLNKQVSALQKKCPHSLKEHCLSPVDSSDNYHECAICGKTFL